MSVLSALRRLRHEEHEFKDDLGYVVIPCLSDFFFLQEYMFVKMLLMVQDTAKQKGVTSTPGGNCLPHQISILFFR